MRELPPPFFKQGPSARVRLIFFSVLAIVLLVVDARYQALKLIRQGAGVLLYPVQSVALWPRNGAFEVVRHFEDLNTAQARADALRRENLALARALFEARELVDENVRLRAVLAARERLRHPALMGQMLYESRDPFTRKIVLDKGSRHGVLDGLPVLDEAGVVGQVTRTDLFTAEVTLLTDKDQAIPVLVKRTGARTLLIGSAEPGMLDMRFMPANADIMAGDELLTSGIDGLYPPGVPVARVMRVERTAQDPFAKVTCQPVAGLDRSRHFLVVLPAPEPKQIQASETLVGPPASAAAVPPSAAAPAPAPQKKPLSAQSAKPKATP